MTPILPSLSVGPQRLGLWFQGALSLLLFAAGRAALAAFPDSDHARPAFLPAGICLVPLVLLGLRYWPAVALSLLGLAAMTRLETSSALASGAWVLTTTIGMSTSALLLRRQLAGRLLPGSPTGVLGYVGALAAGPVVGTILERLVSQWLGGTAAWDARSLWSSIGPGLAGAAVPLVAIGAAMNSTGPAVGERRPAFVTIAFAACLVAAAIHFGPTRAGLIAAGFLVFVIGFRLPALGPRAGILAATLAALALAVAHPSSPWLTGLPVWSAVAPFELTLALTLPIVALAGIRRSLRNELGATPPAWFRSTRQVLPRAEFFGSVKLLAAGLLFTVVAAEWIRIREEREARARVGVVAAQLVNAARMELGAIFGTQQRLALRWQGWDPATHAGWFEDARQILEDLPVIHSIQFSDAEGNIRPLAPVGAATSDPADTARWAARRIPTATLSSTNIVVIPTDESSGPGAGFLSIAGVQRDGRAGGWVGFEFRFDELLPVLKARFPAPIGAYQLAILDGPRATSETRGPAPDSTDRWTGRQELRLQETAWTLGVTPEAPASVLDRWRGSLFILLTGMAFSGLSGVLVFFHRVSRAEAANANEAQRIAGIGSWEIDLRTGGEVWSDQLYSLLGHAPGEVGASHENLFRALLPDDQPGARAAHQAALAGLPAADFTCRIRTPDGETRHLRCSTRVFTNPTGHPQRIVGTVEDVTESTRQANELRRARDDAESANRAKGEFLSTMSHELRTPMNAILGMGDLLLQTRLDASQRELANTVVESGRSLLRVLNDIIEFSRLESGRGEGGSEDIDARDLALNLLGAALRETPAPRVVAGCVVAPEVPGRFHGNRRYLGLVLSHLLSNGLKFTPCGTVVLRISLPRQMAGATVVRFSVTDTGIGIPAGKRHLLFRPFQQLDTSGSRRYGGAGLGLALSQRIVHALGGHIHVESESGSGSVFWFELPFSPVPNSSPPPPPAIPPHSIITVATPQKAVRALIEDLARQLGARMPNPGPGEAADSGTTQEGDHRFVILDTVTPSEETAPPEGPTGSAAAKTIRLVSGIDGSNGAATSPGAVLYPPLHTGTLAAALQSAAAGNLPPTTGRSEGSVGPRVLLLEAQPINRRLTLLALSKLGCEVDTASDLAAALELISRGGYEIVMLRVDDSGDGGEDAAVALRRSEGNEGVTGAPRARFIAMSESGDAGDGSVADGVIDARLRIPFHLQELREALGGTRTIAP